MPSYVGYACNGLFIYLLMASDIYNVQTCEPQTHTHTSKKKNGGGDNRKKEEKKEK